MSFFRLVILVMAGVSLSTFAPVYAQSDSTRSSSPRIDTVFNPPVADSASNDSLTPAERAAKSFEERMRKAREQAPNQVHRPRLSVGDSLSASLLSPRLNQRESLTRSYYMNASDYFKFVPGYFVERWQLTPGRSTVQPFGLAGDRLSYLSDGVQRHPFEHVVEPDGALDVEDLSTALDGGVYVLPGGSGMVLGGGQAIATLVTTPVEAPGDKPLSSFLLDKGSYGFSHTRGRYIHEFSDGKVVRMGIGYRVADGARFTGERGNFEDAYAYDAKLYFPLTSVRGIEIRGHLFHRKAPLLVLPDSVGSYVNRDKFDRDLGVAYSFSNDSQTVRTDVGYTHVRQGSYLTAGYRANFNYTGHGVTVARQWYSTSRVAVVQSAVDRSAYDNGYKEYTRHTSQVSLLMAWPFKVTQTAWRIGATYVEAFRMLPSGAFMMQRESGQFFWQASLGYAERAPSQHELYLPFQSTQLYGLGEVRYADEGNPALKPERQVTGALHLEIGEAANALVLEAVGGGIYDGIEWERTLISVTSASAWRFRPFNEDVTFATVSGKKSIRFGELLRVEGGGAYFWREYETPGKRPYQPDYQLYGGVELHRYWRSKLMHFWAYGEVQYTGAYEGYHQEILGEQAVLNTKVSFSMGNFRFRLVWQNALDLDYSVREQANVPGRILTWGFDWNFFD